MLVVQQELFAKDPDVGIEKEVRRDKRCDSWSLRNCLGQARKDTVFLLAGL
jgi:hypothetical protein